MTGIKAGTIIFLQKIHAAWERGSDIGKRDDFTLEQIKRLRLTNQATIFTGTLTIPYFFIFLLTNLRVPAFIMLWAFLVYLAVLYLNQRGVYRFATILLLINGNMQIASVAFLLGVDAGIHMFLIAAALSPFLYYSANQLTWSLFFAGFSIFLYVLLEVSYAVSNPIIPLSPGTLKLIYVVTYLANITAVVLFTIYLYMENFRTETQLDKERLRSDRLLLNILPEPIANRLKGGETTIADHYDEVSILFADIVGFTPLSEKLAVHDTIDLLSDVFSYFDSIVEKYGVEKIRTVGDNYFIAAGAPVHRSDHAHSLAAIALEMLEFHAQATSPYAPELEVRIGIHTGPVVAGVIGVNKFQYDMWGDAVNTASRMESHGIPGKIHLSPIIYELIKNDFICEPRGPIQVKGKGEMQTWFLIGRRPGAAQT